MKTKTILSVIFLFLTSCGTTKYKLFQETPDGFVAYRGINCTEADEIQNEKPTSFGKRVGCFSEHNYISKEEKDNMIVFIDKKLAKDLKEGEILNIPNGDIEIFDGEYEYKDKDKKECKVKKVKFVNEKKHYEESFYKGDYK